MCMTCGCGGDATRVDGVSVPGSATGDEDLHDHLHAGVAVHTYRPSDTGGQPHLFGATGALHQGQSIVNAMVLPPSQGSV